MSNKIINQHYVPKFYLKGFCDNKSKLCLYDRRLKIIRRNQKVRNFAAQRYYYDIETEELKNILKPWLDLYPSLKNEIDFDDPQYVEKFFSRVESDAAKVIKGIMNDPLQIYDEKNKLLISNFLYLLAYRNANYRDSMSDLYKQFMEQLKERLYDDNARRKITEELGMSKGAKHYQLSKIFNLIGLIHFGEHLIKDYEWYCGIVQGPFGLLTTDNPAINIILWLNDFCFPITPKFSLIFRVKDPNAQMICPDMPNGNIIPLSILGVYNYNNYNLRAFNPYKYVFGDFNDLKTQIKKELIVKILDK